MLKLVKKIILYLFIGQLFYIVVLKWINPPITLTQITEMVNQKKIKRSYVSYDKMGRNIKLAVIASEDQKFPTHNGFDFDEIQRAYEDNQSGKRFRGGSTISQQVAKNVFLWQGRTWVRKGLEVYFTFMIEKIWGKERILEMYLNTSEMGIGVFGIEAAADYYYQKSAIDLSREEAARIAAALPNPRKYNVNPPSAFINRRANQIMRQMRNIQGSAGLNEILDK
ncbi:MULTISPECIES: monofunctional biosynthetic peptidoglycan transglycosylase [Weeksella]|uniref:Biosynthetic peptidoglycan transglycosylase n=1 Tax=Weeksella virosa (strain ATCC 43766 / DSM 16922 / JCM 21250 / CCUG 30538 / CDC 9751 / IAM 14551 / NBRC 16016 / NCTC 11634 / CL345/78) TaxID=865938 RepID=F0NZ08_WEEVC|nr:MULTISPECIES: monofunctional biosynthetic peptidoglycan transglycosylase [Weeksella]ADX68225.1 Monofunctional biosynthetic peptidoglycan transglycosylase [Weeksella virosa DSM 16922]MDK7374672.1 monofunctional biosynthetic peptidoglycan transglycosylase [Weeksella virosa]MDK7674820.1 monofunctional biosynthetic peptidoglycan transglycosylase [Weeksella virosa]OFM83237.1 monofunctional biosynthetic peptidoglycan transglycosylase [Weeksella sp. HMSC059D05]SUP54538.1 Penicillin-binding protein